ncbi:hypothetical protein AAVH_02659 [Aphelenchoides avenae]|nr:hypothetical protein AAVH_02659 [Aphelenchus avenae]
MLTFFVARLILFVTIVAGAGLVTGVFSYRYFELTNDPLYRKAMKLSNCGSTTLEERLKCMGEGEIEKVKSNCPCDPHFKKINNQADLERELARGTRPLLFQWLDAHTMQAATTTQRSPSASLRTG